MSYSHGYLFLQSIASRFFYRLGQRLQQNGCRVYRINFNGGDRIFWPGPDSVDFCLTDQEWPEFLRSFIAKHDISDIILFGDCRPRHAAAIRLARELGIRVHVCEEGYIRPDWVVFEPDGVNGNSTLPRNPNWYRENISPFPPPSQPVDSRTVFIMRAYYDVLYTIFTIAFKFRFPHYRTHRPHHRLKEYAGSAKKYARQFLNFPARSRSLKRIMDGTPYYFFPLQLNSDTQIVVHSNFGDMATAIRMVVASFAGHAPAGSRLVVKEHPLDEGLSDWRRMVASLASEHGVADRVVYLDAGDAAALIARAAGVATVNSTIGAAALAVGKPVVAIGNAIYDIEGLTFQGGLDDFWTNGEQPDPALFEAFRSVLIARCLLPGDLFSRVGVERMVARAVERLSDAATGRSYKTSGDGVEPNRQISGRNVA
jgi:capsular polysaccharide export protein